MINYYVQTWLSFSVIGVGCQRSSTKGADYDGIASETEDGTPCLKWTEGYNGLWASQGEHNYCRNPSNNPNGVLCTTGPSSVGYCDVPFCPEVYTTRTFTCTDWVQNRAYWVWDHDVPAACESEWYHDNWVIPNNLETAWQQILQDVAADVNYLVRA